MLQSWSVTEQTTKLIYYNLILSFCQKCTMFLTALDSLHKKYGKISINEAVYSTYYLNTVSLPRALSLVYTPAPYHSIYVTYLLCVFQVSWWYYPDSVLLTQGKINLAETQGYWLDASGNSYQLVVPEANLTHSGSYVCQLSVKEDEIYRKNFTIYVDGM